MKLIKMLGAALLSCAALVSVGANSQQVPVSCTFTNVSVSWSASLITANQDCKESNGTLVAHRTINASPMGEPSCSESLVGGVSNNGSCLRPSFVRGGQCQNIGKFVAAGCANGFSSNGFSNFYYQQCGSGCSGRSVNLGSINGCSQQSPYLNIYCQ
jgi:hypothetical protein